MSGPMIWAQMLLLRARLTGTTINRLCGSGANAVLTAAQAIVAGEGALYIVGGVESMNRAPFVMPKAGLAHAAGIHDTTIGWRVVSPAMMAAYGVVSMPQTGQNVADDYGISREDQDSRPLVSQANAAAAQEITPITIPQRKGDLMTVDRDEHAMAWPLSRGCWVARRRGARAG